MKRILLTILAVSSITVNSSAQKSSLNKFSIGFEAGLLNGVPNNPSALVGFSLKYDGAISKSTAITVSGGYSKYDIFIPNSGNLTSSFIPLKVGVKYILPWGLYGEGQIGLNTKLQAHNSAVFLYSPGIGYNFSKHADLGIRYESWAYSSGAIGQVTARLAYSF